MNDRTPLDLKAARVRLDAERGPQYLAQPRGAGRHRGVPRVTRQGVPAGGLGDDRRGRPPAVSPADGSVAGAGRRDGVHEAATREDHPLREPAGGPRSGRADVLRDGRVARRIRDRRARRESRRTSDQDRGESRPPGKPRRDGRLHAGIRAGSLRSGQGTEHHLPGRHSALERLPERRAQRRGRQTGVGGQRAAHSHRDGHLTDAGLPNPVAAGRAARSQVAPVGAGWARPGESRVALRLWREPGCRLRRRPGQGDPVARFGPAGGRARRAPLRAAVREKPQGRGRLVGDEPALRRREHREPYRPGGRSQTALACVEDSPVRAGPGRRARSRWPRSRTRPPRPGHRGMGEGRGR